MLPRVLPAAVLRSAHIFREPQFFIWKKENANMRPTQMIAAVINLARHVFHSQHTQRIFQLTSE